MSSGMFGNIFVSGDDIGKEVDVDEVDVNPVEDVEPVEVVDVVDAGSDFVPGDDFAGLDDLVGGADDAAGLDMDLVVEFSDNADPRIPIVVILDVSGSMIKNFDALRDGLNVFVDEVRGDDLASRRAETSFVLYGSNVLPATEFVTSDKLVVPELVSLGATSTGAAVVVGLEALEARKNVYKSQGVEYYRGIVLLISDGYSTDDLGAARELVAAGEEAKKFSFFAVGLDADSVSGLNGVSVRTPLMLRDTNFVELFKWLSASATSVSASQVGDVVSIPDPSGWAQF